MKYLSRSIMLLAIVLLLAVSLSAQEKQNKKDSCCSPSDSTHMTMQNDSTNAKIWNLYCPVLGNEVDPEAPTVTYKGKVIGFCCPGCDVKFKADPEKYMKNLSEDGTKFIGKKQ